MEQSKKRLAIWTHGGIGGGLFGQGFPMIVQIVEKLSNHFQVSVYSEASISKEFVPKGYSVYSPPPSLRWLWLRWVYLVFVFIRNHWKERVHVLFSFWGYPAGVAIVILGKILNLPSIINMLGSETANVPSIGYGHLGIGMRRKLLLWTFRQATTLVAVSASQVENLSRAGFHRGMSVVPWGPDSQQFYPAHKKPGLPLKILHVANLTAVKDQETLIQAFHIIKSQLPAKLRIVGPDFLDGKIQTRVQQMGLEVDVEFMGPVPYKSILEHYHWADIFMLTSLAEGQNNSITEAMMCGLLPVSTPVGIMEKNFAEKVGVVAECGDHRGLAYGIIELYAHPVEWEKKREAARKWAGEHDLDWTINELKNLISNAKRA